MVVIAHGGPFGCSPQDMYLLFRTMMLLQGVAVLITNYRGSTGYGKEFLDSLLGEIGKRDVYDNGELIKKALADYAERLDSKRVVMYGGSHGGFLTGWLIGHPDYCHLFSCAILWNGVLNMQYMVSSTDIPDWCYSCTLNKDVVWEGISEEDSLALLRQSPISVVKNVKTPALILVGGKDLRATPHQSLAYHYALKSMGVKTKLYYYPEDGHGITTTEPSMDALMNMCLWISEHVLPEPPKTD